MKRCLVTLTAWTLLLASSARALTDWPVWGQNAANTRANQAETFIPGPTLPFLWAHGPAGNDADTLGLRFGIIANNAVYGSSVGSKSGTNDTFIEALSITTGLNLTSWTTVGPVPHVVRVKNAWSYFAPSFIQGRLAFGFGNPFTNMNVCPGGPSVMVFDSATGVSLAALNLNGNPYFYSPRVAWAGTADQASGNFYLSGVCPSDFSVSPVKTGTYHFATNSITPNKTFTTGDVHASFAPAVANGKAALALARPKYLAACWPFDTARIAVYNELTGADLCQIGPFMTLFDITPPAMVGNRIYSVNFISLGPSAFDLAACLSAGLTGGTCDLITGSAGPNGGKGMAVADDLVFTSHVGPTGSSVEIWNADMTQVIATYPNPGGPVSPYIAVAAGYIYCVDEITGKPFAIGYNVSGPNKGQLTGVVSQATVGGSSPLGPSGVAAIGEGVLIISSPTLVYAYSLQPPTSATVLPLPDCGTGYTPYGTGIDSVFSLVSGQLLDARIVGEFLLGGVSVMPMSMRFDQPTDSWICASAPVIPFPCGKNINAGVSLTDANTGWAVGYTNCGGMAWQLSPPFPGAWSPYVLTVPTPSAWLNYLPSDPAMFRGIVGPQTGWTGVRISGPSYFDGTNWLDPQPSGPPSLHGMSFVRGQTDDGWATNDPGQFAELDTSTLPGTWILFPLANAFGSTYMKSKNDIYACGASLSMFEPMIFHSGIAGVAPTPLLPGAIEPLPPPLGTNCLTILLDITFYEPNQNYGVSVGTTTPYDVGAVTGALIYITHDGGTTWQFVPLSTPTLQNVSLTKVRFVDNHTAWAIGGGTDIATSVFVPLFVKITL